MAYNRKFKPNKNLVVVLLHLSFPTWHVYVCWYNFGRKNNTRDHYRTRKVIFLQMTKIESLKHFLFP